MQASFACHRPSMAAVLRSIARNVGARAARAPVITRRAPSGAPGQGACRRGGAVRAAADLVGADVAIGRDAFKTLDIVFYNTLSRKKEKFETMTEGKVAMYVCGVTVYDLSHIGHARAYVAFDVLYRFLQFVGYEVDYCRNFTDIDDKIIARANERGEDPGDLTERMIQEYLKDMEMLFCLPPTREPRATEHIDGMIKTIQSIIDNGHAYQAGGDVYFEVGTLPGYGRLSGRKQEDNQAGASGRLQTEASVKRGSGDFVLWKAAKPGEPTWDSPWGPGRPGWHIECSTMIKTLMGSAIDIHGGGQDLVFPHHENEIAQSQAAACCCDKEHMHNGGVDFVRYWLHNGFVNVDNEKMSKSLGNFFTIRDIVHQYDPVALRFFLVSTHYRQPLNYSDVGLEMASARAYYIYQTLDECRKALEDAGEEGVQATEAAAAATEGPGVDLLQQAVKALADDVSTPNVVALFGEPLKVINDLSPATKKNKKKADRLPTLASLQHGLRQVLALLGLPTEADSAGDIIARLRQSFLQRAKLTEEDIACLIEQRAEARKNKDFERGDQIRDELAAKGVLLKDAPEGTTWQPGTPAGKA
ncbi:unnamed protein product [Pedinophyceae sp. YPF-701]|nr:unnamed protein product [Pedinophyceae sp. YPF-701]